VSAHDDIRALLQRYARAVDERDIDALASLFHPDAQISGARGVQALGDWLETMRAPRSFPSSMHVIGEPLIDDDGSGVATTDTYAVVYQIGDPEAGQSDLTLGMRYVDQLVLERGQWVFTSRSSHVVWMR
jgi:SnoaL-like domain